MANKTASNVISMTFKFNSVLTPWKIFISPNGNCKAKMSSAEKSLINIERKTNLIGKVMTSKGGLYRKVLYSTAW